MKAEHLNLETACKIMGNQIIGCRNRNHDFGEIVFFNELFSFFLGRKYREWVNKASVIMTVYMF
jgi:hypothetical protein